VRVPLGSGNKNSRSRTALVDSHSSDNCLVGLVTCDPNDVTVGDRDLRDVTNLRKLLRILSAALRVMTSVNDVTLSVRPGEHGGSDTETCSDVGHEVLNVDDGCEYSRVIVDVDVRPHAACHVSDGRTGGDGGVQSLDGPLSLS